jgi:hypothetical protein
MDSLQDPQYTVLKNDAELLTFPTNHDASMVLVKAHWCGACKDLEQRHLPGIKETLYVNGVPLGIADFKDLSPQMQTNKDLLPSFPSLILFTSRGAHKEHYRGDRSAPVLMDWIHRRLQQ